MKHVVRKLLVSLLVFGLVLAGVPQSAQTVQAAPTELFFSEYIEGSSNNKALEIFNGTGATVDLGNSGYNIQMYFNGSTTAGLTFALTGSVAHGDVYVVAQASASAAILAQADQTNSSGWYNGDDAVVLRKGSTIIDVIGHIGYDPGSEWGTSLVSTEDNTLRRMITVEAGDTNSTDPYDPTLEWNGYVADTFFGLGFHPDNPPMVASTQPANGGVGVPASYLQISFTEAVNVSGDWFSISCSTSGLHTPGNTAVSGGPIVFSLDPATDFVALETCTATVAAPYVFDQDDIDPPDTMLADFSFSFSVQDVCALPYRPIYQIQGSGMSAAVTGVVTTQGVVVGDFETNAGAQGFYLQDTSGDGIAETSDGIFVFTGSADTVTAGQEVRVTGYARERFNQTALNGSNSNTSPVLATNIVVCGTGSVTPADVFMPFESGTYLERFEGMAVRFPQELQISEYFNFDRFGEIVLAMPLEGEPRPFTGTALDEPGADALNRIAENLLRKITLDDGLGYQNPDPARHPNGADFDLGNYFRGGDIVQNAVGVLGYDFNIYRIQPTGPADYFAANPRPTQPEAVGGDLKVSSLNTLNYFLTLDYLRGDPLDNKCGPENNQECRGADADQPEEFTRQRTKLLATLVGLDGDILGLNELENSTGVEPLQDIVDGLNDILGAGTYAYIDTGTIGSDAIKVGLIYKPASVTPVGAFEILDSSDDPTFLDDYNRPVLAQTFDVNATGARFTVAVNHLKSKGSSCSDIGDPDIGDGQGNCNLTRKAAATALVKWLEADPTGSGDADYLIIGDLNSYGKEDPIDAILAGPDGVLGSTDDYTNLVSTYQGPYAYSYVFDGQYGYLDYAIASATLAPQTAGLTVWHINADEADLLDYDTSFKLPAQDLLYERLAYRSSDHDPLLVGTSQIHFNFQGFLPPVENPPAINLVNSGKSVPLKFRLSGFWGLDIIAAGFPVSQQMDCATGALIDGTLLAQLPGDTQLVYDPVTDEYTFTWKTLKEWKGTCRQVTLRLIDGSNHLAYFQFK